ncbi:P-loop containing nucleoside triphosphate hydrolase,ATPase, AAA-type, core,ATPase, AAA-type [Cinara cedri]|uniref:P-loop containing nucleoside triphosphate hydrolase,ATPase, AAA-type, core,ATPase, AAA-type n=1 Tax=Cinara cedri TaxID=506608 RepID=A0A5E4M1P2_9HEMI|nr:P-loop containing nucleoside triphosphate hydrolase,ATPase, AAA-type, core,ATPase, AAA-type [Cinara cedri]
MEHLCPEIERLVSCYTCHAQSLPPYRLCWSAHVGCPPCVKYMLRCGCGSRFNRNSNITFDWLVSSLTFRCKYRPEPGDHHHGDGIVVRSDFDVNDCGHENRRFSVKELREHYRSGCAYNLFTCPLEGCGHVARVETAAEHYEAAHGPFDALEPNSPQQCYEIVFNASSTEQAEIVQKMFNGYFLFIVTPQRIDNCSMRQPRLSMQNINPADRLRYTYDAIIESKDISVKITIVEENFTGANRDINLTLRDGQTHSCCHDKKETDKPPKKKYEPPIPTTVGKKRKCTKGSDAAQKLPTITIQTKCRLKCLKLERIKDYLMMEEEFILNQERLKPQEEKHKEELSKIEDIRGSPMTVGTLEDMIDDTHAIVSTSVGSEHYITVLSFVDKDKLFPGCSVLLNYKVHAIVGVLSDDIDPMVSVMKLIKAPLETYSDIGGLDNQIHEIKEAVELPLTHPEYYEEMGIKPPKGVILYGPPGTGKTLLAKAVANQTSATFLRVVGSELIQKYLGDGPKLVREIFRVAEEQAPTIVFIDEIDAIGTKRYNSNSGGEREIQRTMLELLNQLDGFDSKNDVKVILATNRIETLDPALIRPGRIDRKIEFPLPDTKTKLQIFNIHTSKMAIAEGVNLQELITAKDDLSGADIKAICTEAGMSALNERRMQVIYEDFKKAKDKILYLKKDNIPTELYS